MKLFVCLFFSAMLWTMATKAQPIPRGAVAIELTTTIADSTLFESVQAYLEEAGFDIDVANEEEGLIVTEYKVISDFGTIKEPVQIRMLATLEEGVVTFKGEAISRAAGRSGQPEPIVNTTGVDGVTTGEFALVNELITRYAKTLELATIEYLVP